MEPEEDSKSKKVNDDTVIFLRKRSETEAPRYAARLAAYVDLHRKPRRLLRKTKSKKVNDDTVIFLRKRSETEAPRYAARLAAYVDLHRKRSRAGAARRRSDHGEQRKVSASRKKGEAEQKEKNADNSINTPNAARRSTCGLSGEHPGQDDDRMSRRRGGDKSGLARRSRSAEPSDRCGRRRRKRRSCSRRRRRRRSCRRKKRRRRSRRRRRSCSRRRRRRSCRRKRKRRRRGCR